MLKTLTELCQEIKNWFEREKYHGEFTISDNNIVENLNLQENQYFRIIGSVFNDGIWQYKSSGIADLTNETFNGSIWLLGIPANIIDLSNEIDAWRNKYESIDSQAMSPFSSESFGGYMYSKSMTQNAQNGSSVGTSWKTVFADRLNRWRKI